MTNVSMTVRWRDQLREMALNYADRVDLAARKSVIETAVDVERRAKANFVGSHRRGQPHVGGNKPNVVSGDLRRSIQIRPPVRTAKGSWKCDVGPNMIYGARVEFGYRGTGGGPGQHTTRPFPYMAPAIRAAQPGVRRTVMRWVRAI